MPPSINSPDLWRHLLPLRAPEDHKYTRGAALVLSGPEFRTGAARLAARAALQIGAGLVTIAGTPEALREHGAQVSAIMLRPIASPADFRASVADDRLRAIIMGPAAGIGETTRGFVAIAAASRAGLVLDADALTSFASDAESLVRLTRRREASTILTPHEGEFARLFPDLTGGREERALSASARLGAVVVLKGPRTLIAAPDGQLIENRDAPATLATAGSGDVLAGLIGGLLAQGMPGFEAAATGVWLHGAIARMAGAHPTAEDFVNAIRHLPDFSEI